MWHKLCCAVAAGVIALGLGTNAFAFEAEKPHAEKAKTEEKAAEKGHGEKKGEHGTHAAHLGEAGVDKDPSEFRSDLAIFTFVVFLLLLAILWKFAWGPISEALDKRETAIRNDISSAEQARVKAEQMLAEHAAKLSKVQDEVREIIAEARRDADHTKNEIIAEAQREAEASKRRSITEIERARDTALKDLFDVMSTKVVSATQRVLSKSLTQADQERLVDEALAEFQRN